MENGSNSFRIYAGLAGTVVAGMVMLTSRAEVPAGPMHRPASIASLSRSAATRQTDGDAEMTRPLLEALRTENAYLRQQVRELEAWEGDRLGGGPAGADGRSLQERVRAAEHQVRKLEERNEVLRAKVRLLQREREACADARAPLTEQLRALEEELDVVRQRHRRAESRAARARRYILRITELESELAAARQPRDASPRGRGEVETVATKPQAAASPGR